MNALILIDDLDHAPVVHLSIRLRLSVVLTGLDLRDHKGSRLIQ